MLFRSLPKVHQADAAVLVDEERIRAEVARDDAHAAVQPLEREDDARANVAHRVGGEPQANLLDEMGELARDIDAMTEKLQRFNQNQQELARNISHELRSPLSRMQVALDIAKQSNGNNAEFDRISKEIETLNEMIEYITTLSLNDDVVISSGHMVSRHEF